MTASKPPGFDYPGNAHGANLVMHYFEQDGKSACGRYHINPKTEPCYPSGRTFYTPEEMLENLQASSCCLSCIRSMRHRWRYNADKWRLWKQLEVAREGPT